MKKIILGISLVGLVMSCQKVQEGKNKAVLRLDDSQRGSEGLPYDPSAQGQRGTQPERTSTANTMSTPMPTSDSMRTANVQEVTIKTDSAKAPAATTNP